MKTKTEIAFAALLSEAKQEAINAVGRDLLQLLEKHGFELPAPTAVAPRVKKAAAVAPPAKTKTRRVNPKTPGPSEPRANSDAARVLKAIRAHSGLQTAEVKRAAEGSGAAIHSKTFSTATRRLRINGLVRQIEGRWYPAVQKNETAA
jgi:hypothetical protein